MKVFVVTDGIQDNNDVIAICSTDERAELFRKPINGYTEEIEVDLGVDNILAGKKYYAGWLYRQDHYDSRMYECNADKNSQDNASFITNDGQMKHVSFWEEDIIKAQRRADTMWQEWLSNE